MARSLSVGRSSFVWGAWVAGALDITFRVLAETANEAAVGVLLETLGAADESLRERALRALLDRPSGAGHVELLRRWHTFPNAWKEIAAGHAGRLYQAVRDAVLSRDGRACVNGLDAVKWLREYDLLPALVNAAEDKHNEHSATAGETLIELSERLYEELAAPRDYRNKRDPQLVRSHVMTCLEASLERFDRHERPEIVEAALLIARTDDSVLRTLLQSPHRRSFQVAVNLLQKTRRPGILRLLVHSLGDPSAQPVVLQIVGRRTDALFVQRLLARVGSEPGEEMLKNLKRIDTIAWLQGDLSLLRILNETEQAAAMTVAMHSGLNRLDVFAVVKFLLENGAPAGRRIAASALAEFRGAEANDCVQRALTDDDPLVKAHILRQLRERGVNGAIARLIEHVDHPDDAVRLAARDNLLEFTFERFVASYDALEEHVRRSTALLVRKIDRQAERGLTAELQAASRARRLRALAMASLLGLAEAVEKSIVAQLADADHFVRLEAVKALGHCPTATACEALRSALLDRNGGVQEAAAASLRKVAPPPPLPEPADAAIVS